VLFNCAAFGEHVVVSDASVYFDLKIEYEHRRGNAGLSMSVSNVNFDLFELDSRFLWSADHISGSPFVISITNAQPVVSSFSVNFVQNGTSHVAAAQFRDVFGDVLETTMPSINGTAGNPALVSVASQAISLSCYVLLQEMYSSNVSFSKTQRHFAVLNTAGCASKQLLSIDLCLSGSLKIQLSFSTCEGLLGCTIASSEAAPMQYPFADFFAPKSERQTVHWSGYLMSPCSYNSIISLTFNASCFQNYSACNNWNISIGNSSYTEISRETNVISFNAIPFTLYAIRIQYMILPSERVQNGSLMWESSCHGFERVPPRYLFRPVLNMQQHVTFTFNRSVEPRHSRFSLSNTSVSAGTAVFVALFLRTMFGAPVSTVNLMQNQEIMVLCVAPRASCTNSRWIVQNVEIDDTQVDLYLSCEYLFSVYLLKYDQNFLSATYYSEANLNNPVMSTSISKINYGFTIDTVQIPLRSVRILGFLRLATSIQGTFVARIRLSVDNTSSGNATVFVSGECVLCCHKADISCSRMWSEWTLNHSVQVHPIIFEFRGFSRLSVSNFSVETMNTTYLFPDLLTGFDIGIPIQILVMPSAFSPYHSTIVGPSMLIAGSIGSYEIILRDAFSNTICLKDAEERLHFYISSNTDSRIIWGVIFGCQSILNVEAPRTNFSIVAFFNNIPVNAPLFVGIFCDLRFSSVAFPGLVVAGSTYRINMYLGDCVASDMVNLSTVSLVVLYGNSSARLVQLPVYGSGNTKFIENQFTASGTYRLSLHNSFASGAICVTFFDASFVNMISETIIHIDPYSSVMSFEKNATVASWFGMPVSLKFGLNPAFVYSSGTVATEIKFELVDLPVFDASNIEVHVQGKFYGRLNANGVVPVVFTSNQTIFVQLDITGYKKLTAMTLFWKKPMTHVFQKIPIQHIFGISEALSLGSTTFAQAIVPTICHICDVVLEDIDVSRPSIKICVKQKDVFGNVINLTSAEVQSNFVAFVSATSHKNSACRQQDSTCGTDYISFLCLAQPSTHQNFKFLKFEAFGLSATYFDSANFTQPVSAGVTNAFRPVGISLSTIHPSLSSSMDWSVRWAGFLRGSPGFKGNLTSLVQLQSVFAEGARLWVDGLLIFDVVSAASGTFLSKTFSVVLKQDLLYEIILEYWHSNGPFNLSFSIFEPESYNSQDLAFEMWSAVCRNHSDGTVFLFPHQSVAVFDQAVVWQPSTIWTVGLPVVYSIRTLDVYGNLSNKNPESPLFFSFVSGLETSTDIADIVNYRLPIQTRWVVCASEGQVCFFSGAQIVGYGSKGVPVAFKQANERIFCHPESFGVTTLRNNSTGNQCYISVSPAVSAVSKYKANVINFASPSERVNVFVTFRNASVGMDLTLFSSPECTPHSLVARTKSGLSLNCSDLRMFALFQCIQLDGVIAIPESGLYEIGVWTSDDVMLFINSELVLRSSSSVKAQFYSIAKSFEAFDTAFIKASVVPSSATCMTSFVWKKSVPSIMYVC
jgi:hypothetical protein